MTEATDQTRRVVRLSVNLHPTVAARFTDRSARRGLNMTDAIREAISVWLAVTHAWSDGFTVRVYNKHDSLVGVIQPETE